MENSWKQGIEKGRERDENNKQKLVEGVNATGLNIHDSIEGEIPLEKDETEHPFEDRIDREGK